MENNNQNPNNQNPSPDYSFLNEYKPPEQKPKNRKKVLLLVVLSVLILLMVGMAMVAGDKDRTTTPNASTPGPGATQETSRTIEAIRRNDKEAAFDRLSPALQSQFETAEGFDRKVGGQLRKTLNGYECKTEQKDEDSQNSVIYKCGINDVNFWFGFGMQDFGKDSELLYKLCPVESEEMLVCQ